MDKKNTGLIATIVTTLICGCCALFNCIMGVSTLLGEGTYTLRGAGEQPMPPAMGLVFLCFSLLAILVPAAVAFFTLRKKPETPANSEPTPPSA